MEGAGGSSSAASGATTPIRSRLKPTSKVNKRDAHLINHVLDIIDGRMDGIDKKLDRLDVLNGKGFQKATVEMMLQQNLRGVEYFSREYHVGKDEKTHGFKLICEDTLKKSKSARKTKCYKDMMNKKVMKGKDVVKSLNGM